MLVQLTAHVEILHVMLRSFGLEVANPPDAPTHVHGAALDLVVARPGLVQNVQVFFFSRTFLKPSTRSQCNRSNRSYSLRRVSGSV